MKTIARMSATNKSMRPPRLGNERGMLLVLTMIVMLVLSTLAAASLINSFIERSLAKNQNYASVALQAAEGGISAGVAWITDNRALILAPSDPGFDPDWSVDSSTFPALARTLASGGAYDVTIRFQREWRDNNGDTDCIDPGEESGYRDGDGGLPSGTCPGELVLYNRADKTLDGGFGFADSSFLAAGGGFPLIEIRSVGTYGSGGYREIAMDIARNNYNISIQGAVSSRATPTFSGSVGIDGRAHDMDGTLCSDAGSHCTCTDANPGVAVSGSAAPVAGTGVGAGFWGDPAGSETGHTENPYTPAEALGLASDADLLTILGGTYPVANDGLKSGPINFWNGDFHYNVTTVPIIPLRAYPGWPNKLPTNDESPPVPGYGILIVHNPDFNARHWEKSRPRLGDQPSDPINPNYDASHSHADYIAALDPDNVGAYDAAYVASHKPAVFDMQAPGQNLTFRGVVIADQVNKISGNSTIYGAVISLSTAEASQFGAGTAQIIYSCDAVNSIATQTYSTRLGWHRLR